MNFLSLPALTIFACFLFHQYSGSPVNSESPDQSHKPRDKKHFSNGPGPELHLDQETLVFSKTIDLSRALTVYNLDGNTLYVISAGKQFSGFQIHDLTGELVLDASDWNNARCKSPIVFETPEQVTFEWKQPNSWTVSEVSGDGSKTSAKLSINQDSFQMISEDGDVDSNISVAMPNPSIAWEKKAFGQQMIYKIAPTKKARFPREFLVGLMLLEQLHSARCMLD